MAETNVSGVDLAEQYGRVTRAEQHGSELGAAIQRWARGRPYVLDPVIADDRLSVMLMLRVSTSPPLMEWSHILGESLYQLRSALNTMVVALAKHSGVTDIQRLGAAAFPIAESRRKWKDDSGKIRMLPPDLQTAIRAVQPFMMPDNNVLVLLRDLSDQDRHRQMLTATIAQQDIHHSASVEFESEEAAKANTPPDTTVFGGEFRDGQVLSVQRTKSKIANVRGTFGISVQVQVLLADGSVGVTRLLSTLCVRTREVLDSIAATT